jgi:hypothetical protein
MVSKAPNKKVFVSKLKKSLIKTRLSIRVSNFEALNEHLNIFFYIFNF